MKLRQKKSFFTKTRLIIIIVIIIVAAALGWWFFMRPQSPNVSNTTAAINDVNYGPATDEEKQDALDAKKNSTGQEPNTSQPSTDPSLSLTVTRTDNGSGATPVAVRTLVSGTTNGNCTMTFSKSGQAAVVKTFPVNFQATSASCNGDIPTNAFSADGQWDLSIVLHAESAQSAAVTTTVMVTR